MHEENRRDNKVIDENRANVTACAKHFQANNIHRFTLVTTMLVTMLIAALNTAISMQSHAAERESTPNAFSDSLYFDTSAGLVTTEDSLQTPRYLWVSDKLSFRENTLNNTIDQSSFASKAEYWTKSKWGISSNFSTNGSSLSLLGVPKNSELFNIDVNRQLLRSENKKNYFAVGLGWQNVAFDNHLDVNGLRLSMLGKYSLANRLQVYGASSWFPELETRASNFGLSGYNLEAGLLFRSKSNFSLQAGFRFYDFNGDSISDSASIGSSVSSIFTLGTKLSF